MTQQRFSTPCISIVIRESARAVPDGHRGGHGSPSGPSVRKARSHKLDQSQTRRSSDLALSCEGIPTRLYWWEQDFEEELSLKGVDEEEEAGWLTD